MPVPAATSILISGRGSNMVAIANAAAAGAIPVRIVAVLSDRADAAGLERARELGLPAEALPARGYASREAYDAALADRLRRFSPDVIVLAGLMRMKAEAEMAKAVGDEQKAAKAEELAAAMTQAEPAPAAPEVIEDDFLHIAQNLERGNWIEFEADDGQLVFAKLAWISPLRGTYLFTTRQGQKALSMTADELADRFRLDRARLVEAEPLVDRAIGSVMATLNEDLVEEEID